MGIFVGLRLLEKVGQNECFWYNRSYIARFILFSQQPYGCRYHYYLPFTYERDVKVLSKITQLMSGGCR